MSSSASVRPFLSLSHFVADLVAADLEVPGILAHAVEAVLAGLGCLVSLPGVRPAGMGT